MAKGPPADAVASTIKEKEKPLYVDDSQVVPVADDVLGASSMASGQSRDPDFSDRKPEA
jgi:hypothetical protein